MRKVLAMSKQVYVYRDIDREALIVMRQGRNQHRLVIEDDGPLAHLLRLGEKVPGDGYRESFWRAPMEYVEALVEGTYRWTHSPPGPSEDYYIGEGGQQRLEPVRGVNPMREGIHAVLGFGVVAVSAGLATAFGWAFKRSQDDFEAPVLLAIAVSYICTWLFLRYEETEGQRIRDWAYRDIGGYLVGWLAGAAIAALALVIARSVKGEPLW